MKLLVTKIEYYRLKDNNETIKNSLYFYFIISIPKFFHWYCHFHLLHIQRLHFLFRNVKFPFAKVLKNTEPLSVLLRPLYLPIPYPFHVAISSSLVKITPYPSA